MSRPRRILPLRLLAATLVLVWMMPPGAAHASISGQPSPTPTASQQGSPDQTQPQAGQPGATLPGTAFHQRGPFTTPLALQPRTGTGPGGSAPTKEVFGFATSDSLADPTYGYPSWNFNLLSTVAFFAIHVQYNGILVADSNWTEWDSSDLTGLVNTAHAHGVKVVVTIVGPSNPTDLCDSLYNGATTVLQIVNQVVLKGVDGVNIDYEGQLGQCENNDATLDNSNQALLTAFAKLMRAGLDNARAGYYLSIDTYSGSGAGNDGFFNIPDLNQYVDSFFVMAYDMDYANQSSPPLNCSRFCLSPVSPLSTYYYNDTTSMSQYSAVVGSGKTILGQPYYGRVACVASPVAHATATSYLTAATYVGAAAVATSPDVRPGTFAAHRDANDPTGWDRWDTWYDNSLGCWREMYWPDVTQLGVRYEFVNKLNLRGVGFWTLNYGGGSPELWNELEGHFVTCANANVSASPGSPQPFGTVVQLTATSATCPNPLYQFWVRPPNSSTWQVAQAYSKATTLNWDTASHVAGTYQFSVWARDDRSAGVAGDSLGRWDAATNLPYTLTFTAAVPCTSLATSVSPPSPVLAATPVTITATPAGCPNPRYEFWMLNPKTHVWQSVRAYSSSPSFIWDTTGQSAGAYSLSVWARDATSFGTSRNSLGTWDAGSGVIGITVITKPCAATTITAVPPSPQLGATPVTISGNATGCPNPNYEFWMRAPGSSTWKVAQAYSHTASFNWNTSGLPAGPYNIAVWAKDPSSTGTHSNSLGSWDAGASFYFTVQTQPCTSETASSAPPDTAPAGTAVTITGLAVGCPKPQYEFWVLAPGSSTWQLALGYSASSFNWSTTGKATGVYRWSVWARDASSVGKFSDGLGSWDSATDIYYTLT